MPQVASARLAELLRIERYHEAAVEQAVAAAELPPLRPTDPRLAADLVTMEARYEDVKADLLAAGADARLALIEMEQAPRRGSALRRAAQQLRKSRRRLCAGEEP